VVRTKGPRVDKAVRHVSSDIMIWMNQGGFWRSLFFSSESFVAKFNLCFTTQFCSD
jgi:hypothetical protein